MAALIVARGLASRLRLKRVYRVPCRHKSPRRQGPGISVEIETKPDCRPWCLLCRRQGPGISVEIETHEHHLTRAHKHSRQGPGISVEIETMPMVRRWAHRCKSPGAWHLG